MTLSFVALSTSSASSSSLLPSCPLPNPFLLLRVTFLSFFSSLIYNFFFYFSFICFLPPPSLSLYRVSSYSCLFTFSVLLPPSETIAPLLYYSLRSTLKPNCHKDSFLCHACFLLCDNWFTLMLCFVSHPHSDLSTLR